MKKVVFHGFHLFIFNTCFVQATAPIPLVMYNVTN